jgi:toxin-antitoxin system PIN domain toxin
VTRLLDINLLLALLWERHEPHRAAKRWFERVALFATCPLTQLGFVRISANPAIGFSTDLKTARDALGAFTRPDRHVFWPDAIELFDPVVPAAQGYRQLTDTHLAGLAEHRGGYLATFDGAIAQLSEVKAKHVEAVPAP